MKFQKVAINLLGDAEIVIGGRAVSARLQNKGLALLAYLAAEGKPVPREKLGSLLWPELSREAARSNLRKTLFRLHQALGREDVPQGTAETLFIDPEHVRLDLDKLLDQAAPNIPRDEMDRMAALYRGPFLDGLSIEACPDFEDWLCIMRESCHRHALGLLDNLADLSEHQGEPDKALLYANRYLELEPCDEGAHRRIMRLLARNGNTAGALAHFDLCKRALRREQGVEPDAETVELFHWIRSGQGRPDAVADSRHAAAPAERRQITALYCGFSMSGASDPEDMAERWPVIQQNILARIREFGGHVSQSHGGAVLGYFGYPRAREDAARRAVQAALAVRELSDGDIKTRSGIHTGMAVTSAEIPDSMGLTSTFALHLRDMGAGVTISDATRRLVDGYFHFAAAGTAKPDEALAPVAIHRVIAESGARHRLDAAERLTPFVGRAAEIGALFSLWEQARQGASRIALIRGEAGIGKSRLVREFRERLAGQAHAVRELRCFPEFAQSPFHPLLAMLETIFGHGGDDTPGSKSEKLVRYLEARSAALARKAVPLLSRLLALPVPERYAEPAISPQQQKEQTMETLLGLLRALAERQPVLVILEDLHWIDPSTLELLNQLIEKKGNAPILVLLTMRPEFEPPWGNRIDTVLVLRSLEDAEVVSMVAAIGPQIKTDALDGIVDRAGGIPLFVEEMAKAVQDGIKHIPSTLRDLLAAELDALGTAKRTAQLAATIGREFDFELLRKISADAPMLDELMDAGLVFFTRQGYQFKHALIQEAAYQSQTKPDRQAAHRRIAEALQARMGETQPEILARHWAACGETVKAVESWIGAGRRATLNSAGMEAVSHFRAGLELIQTLPAGAGTDRLEFALQAGLGVALQAALGYGSEEATKANARAAALSRLISDGVDLFQASWAQVMNTIAGVGSHAAIGPARQLLETANARGDPLQRQAAHYAVADAAFWAGDFETTRKHAEAAIALYRPAQHYRLLELFGEDLSVSCSAYLAWSSYFLGQPEPAREVCARMLKQARELEHPHTLALALCFASVLHRWLDMREETLVLSAETIAVSEKHGFPVWLAAGEMTHGWSLVKHGQHEPGIARLKSSIARMRAAIGGISVVFLSALVEAYDHIGRTKEALAVIAEALEDVARTGDGHFTAELFRLKGTCLLKSSRRNAKQAAACFDKALALSRWQHARALESRAAASLALLDNGR